jgi:hypothetical protein
VRDLYIFTKFILFLRCQDWPRLAENAANKNEKSLDLWIPPVSILLLTKNLLKINKFSAKWFTLRLAPTPSRDFRKWKTKSGRIESWT